MASNYMISVPKLKGRENYGDWAFAAENFLILEGLSTCTTQYVEADDAKAKAKLVLTIDPSLYVHIKDAKNTVELWTKLKSMFDDSGFTRKISLLRNLISTRLENCDSMVQYVNQIVETGQKLRGTGFDINDTWIGSLLLAGLPEKFSPMIMAIEHSGIEITTDSIKSKLLDMEDEVRSSGSAFASKVDWRRNKQRRHVGNSGSVGTAGTSRASTSNGPVRNDIQCYKCKQMGHFMNKCPNSQVTESKSKPENKPKTSNAFSAVFLSGNFSKSDWYVDSGASVHLTANQDWLENTQEETEMQEIMVANKTKIPVSSSGDVNITTIVNGQSYDITVKNALCVPELTTNLLSVSQLIKNGNMVNFEMNRCNIYNQQSELVATADLQHGVYRLNIANPEECLLASSSTVSSETWHRRFGHVNSAYLNKMKNGLVKGLDYSDAAQTEKQNCIVCCEGKQSRLPFPHKGTRAKEVLEVIHGDLCGPMEVQSIGGSRYFLLLEDDYTRFAHVYFLKTKNEAFEIFKQFKKLVENQKNTRIKTLRNDNGGEFCSNEFELFLKNCGIVHQTTNSYTPEQNGMLERLNRTIVEKARCLLFDAKLEKKFWAEAVNTAVYLRNRSLASGLNNTPYEMWTGKKPDVSHLRIFGSTVMVHIPKQKRLKWDKKAERNILMGYSETTKGYRVYNPRKNTITISRDVIIMENRIEDLPDQINIDLTNVGLNEENSGSVGDTNPQEELMRDQDNEVPSDNVKEANERDREEQKIDMVRRSERIPKPKKFDEFVTYLNVNDTNFEIDPTTVEDALTGPDRNQWRQAMQEELQSFNENEAWTLADVPESGTVVECKWVFKRKSDSENRVRYRARLVAKGFTQKPGIDYDETFSPVVRYSSLRLLFALSVKLNLNITHLDVATAFLNGDLKESVFMRLPEGFEIGSQTIDCPNEVGNKVLKLRKAIYGLKQSSRSWYDKVDTLLRELGFIRSEFEPCLYMKIVNNFITVIALYVDDFFIFSNDKIETDNLKSQLNQKFKVKDLGQVKQCLGMRVQFKKETNTITLDQEQYIDQILKRFNMIECNSVKTPVEPNLQLQKGNNTCKVPYQQLIGSLMYLAVLTRPDIAFSVSYLSQFNNCFDESHWKQAKHILKYLQGTKKYGLQFKKDNIELHGFVDADWASNLLDRKSYTGFCFKLSGSVISWESRKQTTVALSSTEAEYMALSEAAKEAIYLRNLLVELTNKSDCITLYNDNQSAQKLSVNPMFHKRSKHIDVRHHFIREVISNKLVKIDYLQTAEMPADIFTKCLSSFKHSKFLNSIGLVELS